MPGTLTELPPIEIPGHTSSGLGSPDHPMRIMTRRAAGLVGEPWDDAARAEVSAFFDDLAPEWHTRTGPARDAVVADALDRGVGDDAGDVCIELGSGIGAYTPALATSVAVGSSPPRSRSRCSCCHPRTSVTGCWPTARASPSSTAWPTRSSSSTASCSPPRSTVCSRRTAWSCG